MKRIDEKDLEKLNHKDIVRFALFCAYQVKIGWKDIPECVEAIRVTELWLKGKATAKECELAGFAAYATRVASATSAAYAAYATSIANATSVANAAYYAVNYAGSAGTKIRKAQWDYYYELLHFEKNFEEIVLGVK